MNVGHGLRNHRIRGIGSNSSRRGVATIWVILTVPLLVTAFVVMFNAGMVWLASYESHRAYEAAALAGVQEWGENTNNGPNRLAARNRAVALAGANTVLGNAVSITNNDGGLDVNDNDSVNGNVVLGTLTAVVGGYEFDHNGTPSSITTEDIQDKGGDFGFDAGIPQASSINVTVTLRQTTPPNTLTVFSGTMDRANPNRSDVTFTGTDASGESYSIEVAVVTNTDTFNVDDAFRIDYRNLAGADADPIRSVEFDLSLDSDAHFDLDDGATDLVNDVNGGYGPVLGTGGGETSAQLQQGGEVTFSAATGSPTSLTVTINTNDFVEGRQLYFGADTDQVGPGGSGVGNFGVRIRGTQTIPVSKFLNGLIGSTFGSYNVTNDVFALFPASGSGQPEIVNVVTILP